MAEDKVKVNRAPVLTLWAAVVAERLGHSRETALSLGRAVAGLNAYSKGRSLGIFEEREEPEEKEKAKPRPEQEERVTLLGRAVPVVETGHGLAAVSGGQPISAAAVERYLAGKFRDRLEDVRSAMAELAGSMSPDELDRRAYDLYETFRPAIPSGTRGWGASGDLDLNRIRSLAQRGRPEAGSR